jgi:hypothetical protein
MRKRVSSFNKKFFQETLLQTVHRDPDECAEDISNLYIYIYMQNSGIRPVVATHANIR